MLRLSRDCGGRCFCTSSIARTLSCWGTLARPRAERLILATAAVEIAAALRRDRLELVLVVDVMMSARET